MRLVPRRLNYFTLSATSGRGARSAKAREAFNTSAPFGQEQTPFLGKDFLVGALVFVNFGLGRLGAALLTLGLLGWQNLAAAQEERFVRVRYDAEHRPLALESSLVRYEPENKGSGAFAVDLIAAVHIGEKNYYQQLNEEFKAYDALLYELVASDSEHLEKRQGSALNPISALQLAAKNILQLDFQLEDINYGAANFVHADMSVDEMFASMAKRDESFMRLFMRALTASYIKSGEVGTKPPNLSDLPLLMMSSSRPLALRRLMAQEFSDMQGIVDMINGQEGSTLISERNKVALTVLQRELAAGKKHLGIFYGGAHMPDMERRLLEQFSVKPVSQRWFLAWKLS